MRPSQLIPLKQSSSGYDNRFTKMGYVSSKAALAAAQEQQMTALAFLACGASLLEAPLDLILSPGYGSLVGALIVKCGFVLLGVVMINYGRLAYLVFAFFCCMGILFSCLRVFGGNGVSGVEIVVLCIDAAIKLAFLVAFGKMSIAYPK
jgi:hypothetical protein